MERRIARYEEALRLIEVRANSSTVRDIASEALGPQRRAELKLSEEFWGVPETYHRARRRSRRTYNLMPAATALGIGIGLAIIGDLAAEAVGISGVF